MLYSSQTCLRRSSWFSIFIAYPCLSHKKIYITHFIFITNDRWTPKNAPPLPCFFLNRGQNRRVEIDEQYPHWWHHCLSCIFSQCLAYAAERRWNLFDFCFEPWQKKPSMILWVFSVGRNISERMHPGFYFPIFSDWTCCIAKRESWPNTLGDGPWMLERLILWKFSVWQKIVCRKHLRLRKQSHRWYRSGSTYQYVYYMCFIVFYFVLCILSWFIYLFCFIEYLCCTKSQWIMCYSCWNPG